MKTRSLLFSKKNRQLKGFAVFCLTLFSLNVCAAVADYQERFPVIVKGSSTSSTQQSWNDVDYIKAQDLTYSTCYLGNGTTTFSALLFSSHFLCNIPGGAKVTGIEVEIGRYSGNGQISDVEVNLYSGGILKGENKANPEEMWDMTLTSKIYGGPNDLWNAEWVPSEINPYLGVGVMVKFNEGTYDADIAYIDYVKIRVYYIPMDETLCQGSAVEVLVPISTYGILNPENALGAPDETVATLPATEDGICSILALDLTGEVTARPAEGKIKIRCRNTGDASEPYALYIINASTFTNPYYDWLDTDEKEPFTIWVNSTEFQDYEVSFGSEYLDTRYIQIMKYNSTAYTTEIDAVTYSCGTCQEPGVTLGSDNPVCLGSFEAPIHYSYIGDCDENTRVLIDWEDETMTDIDELLSLTSDYPKTSGHIYAYLPEGTQPGVYNGTLTLKNGDCLSEAYGFSITVVDKVPVPVIEGPEAVCSGTTFTLTAVGAEGASYEWDFSIGDDHYAYTSSSFDLTIWLQPQENTTDFIFKVTQYINGCASEQAVKNVTVYKRPYAGIFKEGFTYLCGGTTYEVQFGTAGDPGGVWQSSNPAVATVDGNGLVTPVSTGDAIISYKVSGTGLCGEISDVAKMNVSVQCVFAEITGNNGPLCGVNDARFYLKGTPGATLDYLVNGEPLTGNNTFNYEGNLTIFILNTTTSQTLQLKSVSFIGCSEELDESSTITIHPIPEVQVEPKLTNILPGETVTLNVSGTADSYEWSPADGLNTTTGTTVDATPAKNTLYTVIGSVGECQGSDEAWILVQEPCSDAHDQYEPNETPGEATFHVPISAQINANLTNSKDKDWFIFVPELSGSYSLNYTGEVKVEITNPLGRKLRAADRNFPNTYILEGESWYYVKVYANGFKSYRCYTLEIKQEGIIEGFVSEMYDDTKSAEIVEVFEEVLNVWPNPTQHEFKLFNGMDEAVMVRISDMSGRTLELFEQVKTGETLVFGNTLAPGFYLVETRGEGIRKVFKVAKQ